MPPSRLWAVDNKGKVYSLSTNNQYWQELPYFGLDFKRVSAITQGIWVLGGDHQIYIYILSSDVPIRFKEITFENQRWNPVGGFSSKLLFTDRHEWSSEDGLQNLPKDSFKLPSLTTWAWESDWFIEESMDASSSDPEGWKYALDFPRHFSNDRRWNSYVRRRKWVRYRKFAATNSWVQIPTIHDDPLAEPLIDISIGGSDIHGQKPGHLCVWAVTVLGRVMYRYGVMQKCPEGLEWRHIPTPHGCEVNQISVGSLGLVWVVSWDGQTLVRLGVSRENVIGTSWAIVQPPNEDIRISQVSVGTNVVWAISREGKVWFRSGIRGSEIETSEQAALGMAWIEMVGEMSLIAVGQNDQVWALTADDKTLCFRSGVTPSELSGRRWLPINLPHKSNFPLSGSDSSISLSQRIAPCSVIPYTTTEYPVLYSDSPAIYFDVNNMKQLSSESGFTESSHVNTSASSNSSQDITHRLEANTFESSYSSEVSDTIIDYVSSPPHKNDNSTIAKVSSEEMTNLVEQIEHLAKSDQLSEIDITEKVRVNRPGTFSIHGHRAVSLGDTDSLISYDSNMALLNADIQHQEDNLEYGENEETSWAWISSGGCIIDAVSVPKWFITPADSTLVKRNYSMEPWMHLIIDKLKERNQTEIQQFTSYCQAVDKTAWVKTLKLQYWREIRPQRWVDCTVELELGNEKSISSGNFTCTYMNNSNIVEFFQIPLREITCCVQVTDRSKPVFAIYTAKRTSRRMPYQFAAGSDAELEDWVSSISTSCCEIRSIDKIPCSTAVWSTTTRGDVFVHESLPFENQTQIFQYFWRQLGGHMKMIETCSAGIVWGIGYDHTAWVYTGGYGGGIFNAITGSNFKTLTQTDIRNIYIYENQRWNPLTGYSARGLPTDRYMWSDKTGRYECLKANTKLPSTHWNWISDWAIDYNNPGGVDKAGWQYAHDFPRSYHAKKGMTDYVRRRRWFRRCKLVTTGPFEELNGSPLIDVSFQVDVSEYFEDTIATWAIASNGDALCRIGVCRSCPKGLSWEHVASDQPFQSISIGGFYRLWTVAVDGSAYFRNGISSQQPIGERWFHVEPPSGNSFLRQISVGGTSVWAVDKYYNLWFRKDVVNEYPEGTEWVCVSNSVHQVSVGPDDQVWAIVDVPDIGAGPANGVVSRRKGITKECLTGTGWEYGIGGGWQHICVRALSLDEDSSASDVT